MLCMVQHVEVWLKHSIISNFYFIFEYNFHFIFIFIFLTQTIISNFQWQLVSKELICNNFWCPLTQSIQNRFMFPILFSSRKMMFASSWPTPCKGAVSICHLWLQIRSIGCWLNPGLHNNFMPKSKHCPSFGCWLPSPNSPPSLF
jgi:hypothetical protein